MEPVPVEFVSLRGALEDHTVRWYLDLRSGELIPQFDDPDLNGEFHEDIETQPELFLHVEPLPSREGFAMDKQVSAARPARLKCGCRCVSIAEAPPKRREALPRSLYGATGTGR